MVKADGIILASPVYFGSATPQIMALIDRAEYVSGNMDFCENKISNIITSAIC